MQYRIVLAALLTGLVLPAQIPDFKPPTPLFGAVLTNNTEAVKKLLDAGVDPNEGRFFGNPALMLAIINGNAPLARTMLARGADPAITDRHGSTSLMWAVGNESPDPTLIDELVKRGVDPNAQNKMGESALSWAGRRGDIALVERLKANGASDANAVRQSVESAIAVLQKSGPQFVRVSGCVSCHHQSLPQMAYAAARERGFQVDNAASTQETQAVVAMIKAIREQMNKGPVNLPNPGISVSYTLLGLAAEGYAPDDLTTAMVSHITRAQAPDGSFPVFPGRPPLEASTFTGTALSTRALKVYAPAEVDRIANARAWLKQATPATQEDRTMRLLGLVWSDADAKDIDKAAADLLAQQRPDGGWAQLAGLESDAYATGQAMVALHEAGKLKAVATAYQRGVAYLLRTQLPDGSWLVRTRSSPVQVLKESGFPHGKHQWISAAGTSWAAMALTYSQPKLAARTESGAL